MVCGKRGLDIEKVRRLLLVRPVAVFDGNALDKTADIIAIELSKFANPVAQIVRRTGFFGGPTMVRGFAPNGFGRRDLTPGATMDNVGGSMY